MSEIQSAVQWLGRLLYDEANYLSKMEDKVKELRDEFIWMHRFLREIDESHSNNFLGRRWIAQFRELSIEAEDTIETFCIIKNVTDRRRDGNLFNKFIKFSKFVWRLKLFHQIGYDTDILIRKISLMTSRIHTYDIKLTMGEGESSWLFRKRITFESPVEEEIIGREDDLKNVVNKLVGKTDDLKCAVLSICGVSGVGKTFLAKQIFYDTEIRKQFDAFAWAYVSSPCQSSAVQQDLLSSLTSKSKEQISQMTDDELKTELRKVLFKYKCLIVLDGLWGKEVWDTLRDSFPIASSEAPDTRSSRSMLLITSQLHEVAKHVDPNVHVYSLQPLDMKQSKQLLENKVKEIQLEVSDELMEKMLRCCDGLPLVISVLGGVLATKNTQKDWKDVHKYLFEDNHSVPIWKRILELSYYDLPFKLKLSFLYLGYFPTNLAISKKKIIRLLEAEDLVSYTDDETSEDTLEDIAEICLAELVERSLVQVVSRGLNGKVKTFLVHNLMCDLCMGKETQGNLLSIDKLGGDGQCRRSGLFNKYQHRGSPSSEYLDSPTISENRVRRLVVYYVSNNLDNLPFNKNLRYLRSMLVLNIQSNEGVSMISNKFLKNAFDNWTLLRVLYIEDINFNFFPEEVGKLIYLRYLSISGSCISKLPSTIKNLRCLETLDLRVLSFVRVRIPDVLWRLERLLHLYLPSKVFNLRHKAKKLQLKCLRNLETLSNFCDVCNAEDVKKLFNLRRFASSDFHSDDKSVKALLSPTSNLRHLERVALKLDGEIVKENLQTLESSRLRKLWLKGKVEPPITSIKLSQKLTRLSFLNTEFQDDPMEVLGKLPSLKKLSLKHVSYTGEAMNCSSESFPELKYLALKGLKSLEVWTVEKEAMPKLSYLKINGCQRLKMLPDGLKFVKSLQELVISFMPFSFFDWTNPKDLTKWSQYSKVRDDARVSVSYVLDLEYD